MEEEGCKYIRTGVTYKNIHQIMLAISRLENTGPELKALKVNGSSALNLQKYIKEVSKMEDLESANWCEYSVYEVVAERDFSEIKELDESELKLIEGTNSLGEALAIRASIIGQGGYAVIKDNTIDQFYEDQEIDNEEMFRSMEAHDDDDGEDW